MSDNNQSYLEDDEDESFCDGCGKKLGETAYATISKMFCRKCFHKPLIQVEYY